MQVFFLISFAEHVLMILDYDLNLQELKNLSALRGSFVQDFCFVGNILVKSKSL